MNTSVPSSTIHNRRVMCVLKYLISHSVVEVREIDEMIGLKITSSRIDC